MSLRAMPEAGKLSPSKLLPCVNQTLCAHKTFERPNSQDTRNRPRERMHVTTGFTTMMKTVKTSVSQFYESWQGSPVTTWADTLSYMPRSSTKEVANHKHEHQTCYLFVAASSVHEVSWQQNMCVNLPTSDVKQETTNLCTMKYLKARSQTTAETADRPIVIHK